MGLDQSRAKLLPDDIDDPKSLEFLKSTWRPARASNQYYNAVQLDSDVTTLPPAILRAASVIISGILPNHLTVLEVFAGNGRAGEIISENMKYTQWMATDILPHHENVVNRKHEPKFRQLDALSAVSLYGDSHDVLLMICPPPCLHNFRDTGSADLGGYADYYACRAFLAKGKGCIIFIGELGRSDGSPGMYRYLLTNDKLQLLHRETLAEHEDILGDPVIKEIFIFQIVKSVDFNDVD